MSGLPPRRSACDRCKGQKLRCLRDPGQERCHRCTRANTQCQTTANLRFRNVLGDDTGLGSRKRARHDGHQQLDPIPSANQRVNNSLSTYFVGNSDHALSQGASSSGLTESWDPSMYGLISSDALDGNFPFFDVSTNKAGSPTANSSTTFQSQPQPSPESISQSQCHVSHWDNVVPFSPDGVIATQDRDVQAGSAIPGEVHIQRLSSINLNLARILGHVGQGSPKISLKTLISPINDYISTPVYSITDGTRELIDILRGLSGAIRRPKSTSSEGSEPIRNESVSITPYDLDSPPIMPSTNGPTTTLDATTLLLILTSYIHVTRLFLIVFAHTYECLREISKSDKPSLCAIPGIDFGDVPLQSGNLQATMFLEIVNNLFQRIESLIGIPQQLRVSKRGSDGDGLLSDEEINGTLKMMISKEELVYQPEYGKGGAKALRTFLEMTGQILREKISP